MNIFLIVYFAFLFLFIVAVFAIIYHLQSYQLNERIATFSTLLFIVGALILLAVNIVSALKVDWGSFPTVVFI